MCGPERRYADLGEPLRAEDLFGDVGSERVALIRELNLTDETVIEDEEEYAWPES